MFYDENKKPQLCLVSTSGDMSKNGMGDKNTIYPFTRDKLTQIRDFLTCQLEWDLATHMYPYDLGNSYCQKKLQKYMDSFQELIKHKISESFICSRILIVCFRIS